MQYFKSVPIAFAMFTSTIHEVAYIADIVVIDSNLKGMPSLTTDLDNKKDYVCPAELSKMYAEKRPAPEGYKRLGIATFLKRCIDMTFAELLFEKSKIPVFLHINSKQNKEAENFWVTKHKCKCVEDSNPSPTIKFECLKVHNKLKNQNTLPL